MSRSELLAPLAPLAPPKPRQDRGGAARRPEILALAKQVIAEMGYQAASLRDIGDRLGMTAPALYHHFDSKQAILQAIIVDAMDRLSATLLGCLSGPGDPRERLERIIRTHVVFTIENLLDTKIIFEDSHFLAESDFAAAREKQLVVLNIYRACIRELRASGHLPEQDATVAALNALAVINGAYRWYHPGGRLSVEDVAAHTSRFVIGGLFYDAAPKPKRRRRVTP